MTGDGLSLERAQMLSELGRHAEARDAVRAYLATSPDDAQALCLYAQTCLRLGDRAALRAAEDAVRLEPDDATPLCLAAFAAAVQRRTKRARAFADAALRLAPDSYDVQYTRAQIEMFAIAPGKEGLAAARRAVALAPNESAGHRVLGELLVSRGKSAEGIPSIREALRLDPNDAAAHDALARSQLRRQRLGAAASGFSSAAALDPTDERAIRNLVVVAGRYVRLVHWVLILVVLGMLVLDRGSTTLRVLAVLGVLVSALTVWQIVMRVRAALPGRARRFVRVAARRDRLLVAWASVLAVGLGLLVAVAVLPDTEAREWRWVFVGCVAGLGSFLRLVHFLRGRTDPRPIV